MAWIRTISEDEATGDLRQVSEDDQLVERVKKDPTTAELTPRQRAIVDFAIKLTVAPKDARREDWIH